MTQPLLIIKTRSGFAVAALPADVVAAMDIKITDLECHESLGGRYSSGGVVDAIRDHFADKPEPVGDAVVGVLKAA